ncbi:MAG: SpoIIE family protein phosphatase [Phycisphaera sp.]|nr:SpoIIE family protein phosphatase [Phycisphaera sp.]
MSDQTLLIVTPPPQSAALAWADAVAERLDPRIRVAHRSVNDVLQDVGLLDRAGVVWVVLDDEADREVQGLLDQLEERRTLTVLSQPGPSQRLGSAVYPGIVALPIATPADPSRLLLKTMLTVAPSVRAMQTEIKLLHLHQSGLCEQIGKIDEELRLAAKLQREFLPTRLPSVEGLEFRVLFRPAGYVSGDIYDVVRLDEDHVGFFVADAVGHGVPAALMTMFIKRSLHIKEVDPDAPRGYRLISPDAAIARLNHDMVHQQADMVRTATACYGLINCKTLELTFARAGHPFPFILHADGSCDTLAPEGPILGVFPEETFELARVRLKPGDRLLLYSDGFEVAFPGTGEDDRIANNRFAQEFHDLAHGPLDEAIQRLANKLDVQTGSLNQRDDLTVVCLGIPMPKEV